MISAKNNLIFTNELASLLSTNLEAKAFSKVFVLVDENTGHHCLPLIIKSLPQDHHLITIKSGEENKTLASCEIIWQSLTSANADRHALLINLGGGVICDMGGFCARTYKRGINFWNIPTTLLSQVDASVGGKLGVDFGVFKNHLGLFSEPDMVFVDSVFFSTLADEEIVSGFAEMVKHALVRDKVMFFKLIEQNLSDIDWQKWVPKSVTIKQQIVAIDPTESGLRKILNFGHTIGHALESYYLDKKPVLKHGEAIAIGMVAETYLSVNKGLLAKDDGDIIIRYLLKVFPKPEIDQNALAAIAGLALQDKKNLNGRINAVLLSDIGEAVFDTEITEDDIRKSLTFYIQQTK